MATWRTAEGVRLQSRAGRDVTSWWPDLAAPAMKFRPGTVVDGEAVLYVGERIDFGAAQSRGATTPSRARRRRPDGSVPNPERAAHRSDFRTPGQVRARAQGPHERR